MSCCSPSRRQILRWSGLAAAAPVAAASMDFPASASEQAAAGEALPVNRRELLVRDLEVVTVTEQSAIITWFPGSADETDTYGRPAPGAPDTEPLLRVPGEPETRAPARHAH